MKPVKYLTTWLKNLAKKVINVSAFGERLSWKNYEKEGRKMDDGFDHNKYTTEQMTEIYAKLEVSKMLIKMGTDMAKQIEADIKFFRMTNGIED